MTGLGITDSELKNEDGVNPLRHSMYLNNIINKYQNSCFQLLFKDD